MGFRCMRWVGPAVLATLLLLCGQPAMAAMKIASATLLIPEDDKPILLAGLEYGDTKWNVAFVSIRLDRDPNEGADPARQVWTFSATSTRPMIQKVIIEIQLLDGLGKNIKSMKQFVVVKSSTDRQEIPIKMKVRRTDWERAEKVRIKTTFTVL